MSKATPARQQSARARIAAQQAAERRAETRRRLFVTGGSVLAVIVIVVAFILVKSVGGGSPQAPAAGGQTGTPLPASVIRDITSVPASTAATVGKGTTIPRAVIPLSGTPLTSGGKPEVLYIGAEYCPFCAAERWAMAVALSRFGTFSGLRGIHSSSTDVYPNTPTLTFYKSTYTSKYLTFTPVETTTVDNAPLQNTTAAQQALLKKYDVPPYVSPQAKGAIPFIDFGSKFMISGASYSPQVLQGKTWSEVASSLSNPSSPISQGAVGAANLITAALCKLTGNQPASACTPAVLKLEAQLP
jgi:thiol-disulfide isomerase/thioredoxin